MTVRNLYATLSEYKAFVTARGQSTSTDTADDGVISDLLQAASRYIDSKTTRWFYPRVETRNYTIPYGNQLDLDADLLEVLTLTNGDLTSIASTEYNLLPKNYSPKYALEILDTSSVVWETNTAGESKFILALNGVFGYHDFYADAWESVGTLSVAITDTTTLAFSATTGHSITPNQILKIGSELYNVVTAGTNTITPVKRGDNGSTAATHLISTVVYAWKPMEGAKAAVLEITMNADKRRFGEAAGGNATITAAGVVITPRDIPAMAADFMTAYRRIV